MNQSGETRSAAGGVPGAARDLPAQRTPDLGLPDRGWRPRQAARRGALLAAVLLLAACNGRSGESLRPGMPGLDLADAALRAGSPQIALQATDGLLATNPNDAAVLLVRADALTGLGRFDDAAETYQRVLQADPHSVGAQIGLGRIRLANDPAGAETLFLRAIQEDPRNTIALTDLGIARDLQGRHADAQQAYRQALGINPELRAAQVNMALSMAMSGQGDGAVRMMRPLAEAPNATRKLRHDYAAVLAMSGNRTDAERILSADLSPAETRQALDAYAAHATTTTLLADTMPSPTPEALQTGVTPGGMTPASARTTGPVQVQLSAAISEDAANSEWQRLQEKLPAVMSGHAPQVTRVERDGHVFWRLRTSGFATPADARTFCDQLRRAGSICVIGGV